MARNDCVNVRVYWLHNLRGSALVKCCLMRSALYNYLLLVELLVVVTTGFGCKV